MMNLTVSSRRGMMMCSIELTRRFVDRITSSSTVNAVCNPKKRSKIGQQHVCRETTVGGGDDRGQTCNDASSTSVSTALTYVSLHFCTSLPPRPNPVNPNSPLPSFLTLSKVGSTTPDTFSDLDVTVYEAWPTDSRIWYVIWGPVE